MLRTSRERIEVEEIKIMTQDESRIGNPCPRCKKIVGAEHRCDVPVVYEIVIDDSLNITEKL